LHLLTSLTTAYLHLTRSFRISVLAHWKQVCHEPRRQPNHPLFFLSVIRPKFGPSGRIPSDDRYMAEGLPVPVNVQSSFCKSAAALAEGPFQCHPMPNLVVQLTSAYKMRPNFTHGVGILRSKGPPGLVLGSAKAPIFPLTDLSVVLFCVPRLYHRLPKTMAMAGPPFFFPVPPFQADDPPQISITSSDDVFSPVFFFLAQLPETSGGPAD